MADALIEAKAERYVKMLRRMFNEMGAGGPIEGDEELLARARRHAVSMLSMERGRRIALRETREMTRDMFDDPPAREDSRAFGSRQWPPSTGNGT